MDIQKTRELLKNREDEFTKIEIELSKYLKTYIPKDYTETCRESQRHLFFASITWIMVAFWLVKIKLISEWIELSGRINLINTFLCVIILLGIRYAYHWFYNILAFSHAEKIEFVTQSKILIENAKKFCSDFQSEINKLFQDAQTEWEKLPFGEQLGVLGPVIPVIKEWQGKWDKMQKKCAYYANMIMHYHSLALYIEFLLPIVVAIIAVIVLLSFRLGIL